MDINEKLAIVNLTVATLGLIVAVLTGVMLPIIATAILVVVGIVFVLTTKE
jgi:hypothetical protein